MRNAKHRSCAHPHTSTCRTCFLAQQVEGAVRGLREAAETARTGRLGTWYIVFHVS